MNTGRQLLSGAGTQTAGLAFGGNVSPSGATEEYDGSTWAAGGTMGTARYRLAGAGTQTAGLAFAGLNPIGITGATEAYDGSAWSTQPSMITARRSLGGAGTQTVALVFGGSVGPPTQSTLTEEFNGASSNTQTLTIT